MSKGCPLLCLSVPPPVFQCPGPVDGLSECGHTVMKRTVSTPTVTEPEHVVVGSWIRTRCDVFDNSTLHEKYGNTEELDIQSLWILVSQTTGSSVLMCF